MHPKHNDTNTGPNEILKSQKPTWNLAQKLISEKCDANTKRNNQRKIYNPEKLNLIGNRIRINFRAMICPERSNT